MFNMKKLHLINIFSMQYHLEHSDEWFGKNPQKTVRKTEKFEKRNHVFSNLLLNCKEFGKVFCMKKVRLVSSFPTAYHTHQSDKRFENHNTKTARK
jgi:hypothetical protein